MLKQFRSRTAININFLVDETGQTSVDSELPDGSYPLRNTYHNHKSKPEEQLL